jgi:hypothetical protein
MVVLSLGRLSNFVRWDVVLLLGSMAVVLAFEMLGVFGGGRYATITAIVRDYVPRWARAMMCGWLCWHFVVA